MNNVLSKNVSIFLDTLNHPLRNEINKLRTIILQSNDELEENIKWNSPNYSFRNEDRFTMRVQPPKKLQLILHRGVKKLEQPSDRLIKHESTLLQWKENDRAVITFRNATEIDNAAICLTLIINKWITASL